MEPHRLDGDTAVRSILKDSYCSDLKFRTDSVDPDQTAPGASSRGAA